MDMKGGQMPEMPQAPEKLQGLEVVTFSELEEGQKKEILSLQHNALDTEKSKNLELRKDSLKEANLYHEHLKDAAHGDVLVAMHEGHVIGVLTLNRSGGVGTIDDIWLPSKDNQKGVIAQLLEAAKENFRNAAVRCDTAVIKADHPSPEMRRVFHAADTDTRTFFTLEAKDN